MHRRNHSTGTTRPSNDGTAGRTRSTGSTKSPATPANSDRQNPN
ncbi:hypothetical protein [Streptomyces sp. F001]|nr:hypothetical protein [Streptomyces sp. F001]